MAMTGGDMLGDDSRLPEPDTATGPGLQTTTMAPGAFPSDEASDQGVVVVQEPGPLSLADAVWARRDEFTRKKSIKIKVGTWNVASIGGTENDLGLWFVKGGGGPKAWSQLSSLDPPHDDQPDEGITTTSASVDTQERRKQQAAPSGRNTEASPPSDGTEIDLYVLGLQEVVDINSVTVAMKTYTDANTAQKWKTSLQQALPEGYELIAEQQLMGLLILISASPDLAPSISNVSCTSVGTGLMGYMGNKGAVSVRLLLSGLTRACFVNCHLSAGADKAALERRIWDAKQILARTSFSPVSMDGHVEGAEEKIGDEDVAFWFGDLNCRLEDIPGEDVRRLLHLHAQNKYDVLNACHRRVDTSHGYVDADGSSSQYDGQADQDVADAESEGEQAWLDPKSDPASLITTIESLLAHDQLRLQQQQKKAFHQGWREGQISFLPTYKYDVGSVGMFDSGEKRRNPSWCDRILFRTKVDHIRYEEQAKQEAEARRRDQDMKKRGIDQAAEEHNILFDYDPDEDGMAYGEECDPAAEEDTHGAEALQTHDYHHDGIEIDGYASHQNVVTSDHKPVDAIFSFTYDAILPELRAQIQQEVVRDLDKAENESRPSITLVIDHHDGGDQNLSASAEQAELNVVHFGSVAYGVAVHRSVTIANTGQIEATARFIGKEDGGGPIVPGWLNVSLAGGLEATLEPGESKVIDLTARVWDGDLVRSLNHYRADLEDILILRIDGGRDHFLPVKAKWLPSCFYRCLDELVVAPECGVRSMAKSTANTVGEEERAGARARAKAFQQSVPTTRHSAPRELFALTESIAPLAERSIAEWDMLHPGQAPPWSQNEGDNSWPFDSSTWTFHEGPERDSYLAKVRECLDRSQPLDQASELHEPYLVHLEVLCETVVSFLGSLQDGIITTCMWSVIESSLVQLSHNTTISTVEAEQVQGVAMEALSSAPVHSVSMTFLTFMLSTLINQLAPALQEWQHRHRHQQQTQYQPTVLSRSCSFRSETQESEGGGGPSSTRGRISLDSTRTADSGSKKGVAGVGAGLLAKIPIRRKRTDTTTSSQSSHSNYIMADNSNSAGGGGSGGGSGGGARSSIITTGWDSGREQRQQLIRNYAAIFAPLVIRSIADDVVKGKERKVLEARKQRVIEAFLEVAQL